MMRVRRAKLLNAFKNVLALGPANGQVAVEVLASPRSLEPVFESVFDDDGKAGCCDSVISISCYGPWDRLKLSIACGSKM